MIKKHLACALFAASLASCSQSNKQPDPVRVKALPLRGDLVYRVHVFDGPSKNITAQKTPSQFPLKILTKNEGEKMLAGLQRSRGHHLAHSPIASARYGQMINISEVKEFAYPSEYDAPILSRKNGKTVAVTPAKPTKFQSVDLGLKATLTGKKQRNSDNIDLNSKIEYKSFQGFVNYGKPITGTSRNFLGMETNVVLAENKIQMPVFTSAKQNSNISLQPGGFILLEQKNAQHDNPRFKLEKPENTQSGNFIILIQVEQLK